MSVSLDRLYHYIEHIAEEQHQNRVIIYRFFPHGSKKIENLTLMREQEISWLDICMYPAIWCHDQEPLNHQYYKTNLRQIEKNQWMQVLEKINVTPFQPKNLNYKGGNIYAKSLLLHSEKRSPEVVKYQQDGQLIPVYYWSHAVIARDWFRYAEHERFIKRSNTTFLIYNRAWAGTREYRLKFTDLLIEKGLVPHCKTTVNPNDPEVSIYYRDHKFINPQWRPNRVLENFLQPTLAQASSSADFETMDYNDTDIEVVLETLFDDSRLHLTEKSLRPIACGQPFLLAATTGSLEYLRSYGFKTFDTVWNEDYDLVEDPYQRLQAIIDVMKDIAEWDDQLRKHKLEQARKIAEHNRQWFFSKDFSNLIQEELQNNLLSAFKELENCNNYHKHYDYWKKMILIPEVKEFLETNQNPYLPTQQAAKDLIEICEKRLHIKNNQP